MTDEDRASLTELAADLPVVKALGASVGITAMEAARRVLSRAGSVGGGPDEAKRVWDVAATMLAELRS